MIKINLPDVLPPEIEEWTVRALDITNEILAAATLEDKHRLIDRYNRHWRDAALIRWLSSMSFDKCWYTETKFGGDFQEVEHFRPKKNTKINDGTLLVGHPGYYWLAFDLENYRLCKRRLNLRKSTYFPVLDERFRALDENHDWRDEHPLFLDPLDEEDHLLLSFNDDGKPVPADGLEDQDVLRVRFTIDKYHLDEEVLNRRREETWSTTRSLYNKYLHSMNKAKNASNGGVALRARAKENLVQLKKLLEKSEEFSSVAKQSLIKTNEPMAVRIASC